MDRDELSKMLADWQATNVSFIVKFFVITSLVIGIIPFFGLVFGLLGMACTYKSRSRWRLAAKIGLGLSLLSSLAAIVLIILANHYSP